MFQYLPRMSIRFQRVIVYFLLHVSGVGCFVFLFVTLLPVDLFLVGLFIIMCVKQTMENFSHIRNWVTSWVICFTWNYRENTSSTHSLQLALN